MPSVGHLKECGGRVVQVLRHGAAIGVGAPVHAAVAVTAEKPADLSREVVVVDDACVVATHGAFGTQHFGERVNLRALVIAQ